MYGSYFYLFVEFAVMRFIIAPRRRAAKMAELAGGKTTSEQPAAKSVKRDPSLPAVTEEEEEEGEEVPMPRPMLMPQESSYSLQWLFEDDLQQMGLNWSKSKSSSSSSAAAAAATTRKKRQ